MTSLSHFQLENLLLHSIFFEVCFIEPLDKDSFSLCEELLKHKKPIKLSKLKNKDTPVVLFCTDGRLSSYEQKKLEQKGYKNAFYFQGGLKALESSLKEA